MEEDIRIIGDVRYSKKASILYDEGNTKSAIIFLQELQKLMEEFGVVKIDVCLDIYQ